ncbi:hypothetical protein [Pseudomonas taetrolens]|uniref:hypothetical protein n=1 Tax=Pseudomonas taetrolens TaxID=47884 RepID=UPI003F9779BF
MSGSSVNDSSMSSGIKPAPTPAKRAGDIEYFPAGQKTYLAPLPLPTGAQPYCPYISDYNDIYLDFGGGMPNVFSYQANLGIPLMCASLTTWGFSILLWFWGVFQGGSAVESWLFARDYFLATWPYGVKTWLAGSTMCFAIWLYHHLLFIRVIPTRFNRQRREVCFMLEEEAEPLFVPWESLSAWVVQEQAASQYGVVREYEMGMGFEHEGEWVRLEFQCGGLQLAIAHWEAVRGYMEYELDELKAVQDPLELSGPDDPPHEGLHTFRNARARLHQQIRDKEAGWVYGFFWYFYHVMTLWTLPNRLVEWEIKRIAKVGRRELPDAMREWSEPLPPEQWAPPGRDLVRLSAKVNALSKRFPRKPITEVFAEVCRGEPNEGRA